MKSKVGSLLLWCVAVVINGLANHCCVDADKFSESLPPAPPAPRSTDDVIAAVVFHRHGDRSPTVFMPNSRVNNARWPSGTGQLTARGMHNEFILGQALRSRYVDQTKVLSASYNRTQYYVRSTDFERTLQSASSAAAGLYPPGTLSIQCNKLSFVDQSSPAHIMP
jgi:hypothetical protein